MVINDREITVERKNVKHINLKVYPDLSIKASIPNDMDLRTVKKMILSKDSWISAQIKKYNNQSRLTKREYVSGEDHYINGKRYILNVIDSNSPKIILANGNNIYMYVRKSSSKENKEKLLNSYYRSILDEKIKSFIPELEALIGVKINNYHIRKMKNKWGSCNSKNKYIILNLELAKKKDSEIKYVIVHELLHLIEEKHNDNFKKLMFKYCPKWEEYNKSINELLNSTGID